ncbi:putative orfan [Tupanvirus soda lake]|uniref:Orfan n=2 Tax=Tupanvirus TaxID=2094720 RepID=A0AC62ACX5_9VIRU|nr:putative orfan [Tupanvirus soda lake]QKU35606.1 putative orfan [Tupanvirus soda lake]
MSTVPMYHMTGYVSEPIPRSSSSNYGYGYQRTQTFYTPSYPPTYMPIPAPSCTSGSCFTNTTSSPPIHGNIYGVCPVGPATHGEFKAPR